MRLWLRVRRFRLSSKRNRVFTTHQRLGMRTVLESDATTVPERRGGLTSCPSPAWRHGAGSAGHALRSCAAALSSRGLAPLPSRKTWRRSRSTSRPSPPIAQRFAPLSMGVRESIRRLGGRMNGSDVIAEAPTSRVDDQRPVNLCTSDTITRRCRVDRRPAGSPHRGSRRRR
jgi:hypothetical protein